MKILARFLALVFALQTLPLTKLASAQANSCAAGLVFSSIVNRCLSSEAASRVKQSEAYCMSKEGSERNQCFQNAANGEVEKKEAAGEIEKNVGKGKFAGNKTWSLVLNALALTAAVVVLMSSKESGDCSQAYSLYALGAGAVIAIVGEIWTGFQYKGAVEKLGKKLSTLEEDAEKGSDGKASATNIQAQAFQAMADQQAMIAKIAKAKKGWYNAAFMAYTASAALSAFEIASSAMGSSAFTTCKNLYGANSSPSADSAVAQTALDVYLREHAQHRLDFKSWQAREEKLTSYHFHPTDGRTLLFQLFVETQAKSREVQALDVDAFERFQERRAEMDKVSSIFLQLELLADQLLIPKAFAQMDKAWEDRKKGRSAEACKCEQAGQTAQQMKMNFRDCDFKQEDLNACMGAGAGVQKIAGRSFIGSKDMLKSQDAKVRARTEKSREECSKYLSDNKCTAQVVKEEGVKILEQSLPQPAQQLSAPIENHLTPVAQETQKLPESPALADPVSAPPPPPSPAREIAAASYGGIIPLLANSWTRLAIAGAMALYSRATVNHYQKEAEVAEGRKVAMLQLKSQVSAAGTAFGCAGGRNDQTNPNCYCYTESGEFNPARAKQSVCNSAYESQIFSTSLLNGLGNAGKVCVGAKAMDVGCSCQAKGTCMKTGLRAANLPKNLAQNISPMTSVTEGLMNGTLDAARVGNFDAGTFARGMSKMEAQLLAKVPDAAKKKAQAEKALRNADEKLDRALRAASGGAVGTSSFPSGVGLGGFGAQAPRMDQLANSKDASELLKSATENLYSTAPMPVAAKGSGRDDFELAMGTGPSESVRVEDEAGYTMSDFKEGNADINTDASAGLFEIISNRYQRSGLKRLFAP